ncbi:MAG: hypothetical protein GYA55_01675 [SAR324 cluster bacterium]|uniref:Lipoprotein SmpA/OmlA domain-containing protein n=1 Tax=SAR324 cluster bacterium TaxID=2024889 RepID=A0A7X9IJ78_9DELT|nr:hypothetical protein [SAR324 cluster bacterium]
MKRISLGVLSILLSLSSSVFGKEFPPVLQMGMSKTEVLTRAGSPRSKTTKEIKREEIWDYDKFSVSFKDEYVVGLKGVVTTPFPTLNAKENNEATSKSAPVKERETPPDLLRNILKELPEPSKSKVQPPSVQSGMALPQQAGAPGGIVPMPIEPE